MCENRLFASHYFLVPKNAVVFNIVCWLFCNHPKYADLLIAKKLASVYSRVFL